MKKEYFGFVIWLTIVAFTGTVSYYLLNFSLMDSLAACAAVGIATSLIIVSGYFGFVIWVITIAVTGSVLYYLLNFSLIDTLKVCIPVGLITAGIIVLLSEKEKLKVTTYNKNENFNQ